MPERRTVLLLVVLALLARLLLQGWDSGFLSPHPDERQVAFVAERAGGWFSDPGFYAYGSLHFRAVRAAGALLGGGYQWLIVGGRLLSLLASVASLLVAWAVARRAWGRRTAVLVLLLGALVPLDLQQSHFATVEAHHALWSLLALAGCFWLAVGGRTAAAAATGVAIGASLAVKVASLPLMLPLAVAVAAVWWRGRWTDALRVGAAAAAGGILSFWLAQPWAFADARPPWLPLLLAAAAVVAATSSRADADRTRSAPALLGLLLAVAAGAWLLLLFLGDGAVLGHPVLADGYLRGVGEQVDMVLGRSDLPYVRVYAPTLPILYPLRELALWGLGPALLAAALAAAVVSAGVLLRRLRRRRIPEGALLLAVLLSWLAPMALRLATLEVKYLRYWQPLVVPGVLLAAWWLARLRRPVWRRLVVGATLLWGVMYVWGFLAPHPHRVASEWLSEMVARDQAVAFEHWDETVVLPPGPRVELASYELPDDRRKALEWAEALSEADWVVLTSHRVRRSVLANPDRYPRTGRLYRLLLAGEAGFEPLTVAERAPGLLGLRLPVQAADESFVNYDFPRVVVLRRVAKVDPEALADRVERPLPGLEGLGPGAVERRLVDPLPAIPPIPSAARQAVDVLLWAVVLVASGSALWVLLLPVLRGLPDGGWGLCLTTAWIVAAWAVWLGADLGLWPAGQATASLVFLALVAAGGAVAWRRRSVLVTELRRRRRALVTVAAAAAVVWLLFLGVRLFNPAIHWGEKPMDFSFLNAFVDSPEWPPGEPWMAGMPLHYYYFGDVLAAWPILVTGTDTAVGYNLVAASVPALATAVLATFGLAVARRRRAGWLLPPLLVVLTGNLAWPWLLDLARQGRLFDMWWATSRVVPGFAIDEYPLWTALFADLHGHFLALPVVLASLAWGWLTISLTDRRWLVAAAGCGLSAGVVAATNPWDLLLLTAALGAGVLAVAHRPLPGLGRIAAAGAASIVLVAPFVAELSAGIAAGAGGGRGLFLTASDFAPWWAVVQHFGVFLVPLLAVAAVTAGRGWLVVAPLGGAAAVTGLAFGSTSAVLALASAALFAVAVARTRARTERLAWVLAVVGTGAVAACERFTLIDRMNTLFKVYNGVWVLLAVALALLLLRLRGPRRTLLVGVWLPLQAVALVNLPLGIVQGVREPRMASPRPTLDGQAFLRDGDPQTWFLVRALEAVARPGDVVAEASGQSYAEFTRISMHTGLPTVVGWDFHLEQRGQSRREVEARRADLAVIYGADEPLGRRRLLDRYDVRWVVVAGVERRAYRLTSADPMAGVPGVVTIAADPPARLELVRDLPTPVASAVDPGLPPDLRQVGHLSVPRPRPVRSLFLDEGGALAVLADGSLLALDGASAAPPPDCDAIAAVRHGGGAWVACGDGEVLAATADGWRSRGRPPAVSGLVAGEAVWAFGADGLHRSTGGRRWARVAAGPVVAAAATGGRVAYSDGAAVRVEDESGVVREVGRLRDVRGLAWAGGSLWAQTDENLVRSGGALLPWRPALEALRAAAIAGAGDRLWLVLDDGRIVEHRSPPCLSPFAADGSATGLDEPRDIAVSPDGVMVVADTGHHAVRFYSPDGACIGRAGGEGSAPAEFREPAGVDLGLDGTVAVADTWNGRIQLLRADGSVALLGDGLYGPRDVLLEEDGGVVVADTGNRRVLRYRPPDWRQEELLQLDGPAVGLERVGDLLAVAVPVAGVVVLVDRDGREVRRLQIGRAHV